MERATSPLSELGSSPQSQSIPLGDLNTLKESPLPQHSALLDDSMSSELSELDSEAETERIEMPDISELERLKELRAEKPEDAGDSTLLPSEIPEEAEEAEEAEEGKAEPEEAEEGKAKAEAEETTDNTNGTNGGLYNSQDNDDVNSKVEQNDIVNSGKSTPQGDSTGTADKEAESSKKRPASEAESTEIDAEKKPEETKRRKLTVSASDAQAEVSGDVDVDVDVDGSEKQGKEDETPQKMISDLKVEEDEEVSEREKPEAEKSEREDGETADGGDGGAGGDDEAEENGTNGISEPAGEAEAEEEEEDEQEVRKRALEALTEVEVEFAKLRDALYDDKMRKLKAELQMCVDGTHPDLLPLYEQIDRIREEKVRHAVQSKRYKMQCIENQTRAQRVQIHQQFLKDQCDIRAKLLHDTTQEWYKVNRERRAMDSLVPEYGFWVPDDKQKQLEHRLMLNQEISIQVGVKNKFGFPAAPVIKSANRDEIDQDLLAMGIPATSRRDHTQGMSITHRRYR